MPSVFCGSLHFFLDPVEFSASVCAVCMDNEAEVCRCAGQFGGGFVVIPRALRHIVCHPWATLGYNTT